MTEHPVLDDLPPGDWHHLPRARVEPAAPRSLGPTARLVLRLIRRRARVPRDHNVFRTLARLRGIFPAHAVFLSQILLKGRLPAAEKELVILRVAWRQGCVYEWSLHSPMATAAGVPEHHKRAAAAESPRFDDPRPGALVAATDEILASPWPPCAPSSRRRWTPRPASGYGRRWTPGSSRRTAPRPPPESPWPTRRPRTPVRAPPG
ncbi:hypothetical protein GCM10010243_35790 [Streptomyces matensis]|nr:carboxymuconolactone decarboxylase family protein [Actinospica acidiphila]GGT54297.1 hypothetical protein GCM10010243_35790 [Streptomyces matensis]